MLAVGNPDARGRGRLGREADEGRRGEGRRGGRGRLGLHSISFIRDKVNFD